MKIKRGIVSPKGNVSRGLSSSDRSFSFSGIAQQADVHYLPFSYSKSLLPSKDVIKSASFRSEHISLEPIIKESETFADILSLSIVDLLRADTFQAGKDGCFPETFYETCALNVSRRIDDIYDDAELLVIYAKQMMIIMKSCGIVRVNGGKAILDESKLSHEILFNTFWNKVKWEDLFPSMPSTASRMRDERYLLAELLLSREDVFGVDDLAGDYFTDSSVAFRDQLIYISFFDFSFFTWMRHFGIVKDTEEIHGRVAASLTARGRHFLSTLS